MIIVVEAVAEEAQVEDLDREEGKTRIILREIDLYKSIFFTLLDRGHQNVELDE